MLSPSEKFSQGNDNSSNNDATRQQHQIIQCVELTVWKQEASISLSALTLHDRQITQRNLQTLSNVWNTPVILRTTYCNT